MKIPIPAEFTPQPPIWGAIHCQFTTQYSAPCSPLPAPCPELAEGPALRRKPDEASELLTGWRF